MIEQGFATPAPAARGSTGARPGVPWDVRSAALGAVLWLGVPFLPLGSPPALASLEHLLAFMPLVVVPLALPLLAALLGPGASSPRRLHRLAARAQPAAAAMLLASFCLDAGPLAGALAGGWLAFALLVAAGGAPRSRPRAGPQLSGASLLAAQAFLPVGATWLLLARLGLGPRGFTPLTVLLAALHFHFSGFALQLLIAATGRRLAGRPRWLGPLHRLLAAGAIAGIPLIAAGNLLGSPRLKVLGVAAMVLGTVALAVTTAAVALEVRQGAARSWLLLSSASLLAGMILAGVYGWGELTGRSPLGIRGMVATHGLLNALGFTLCGLLGHRSILAREAAR